jgi:hypothetical protein
VATHLSSLWSDSFKKESDRYRGLFVLLDLELNNNFCSQCGTAVKIAQEFPEEARDEWHR